MFRHNLLSTNKMDKMDEVTEVTMLTGDKIKYNAELRLEEQKEEEKKELQKQEEIKKELISEWTEFLDECMKEWHIERSFSYDIKVKITKYHFDSFTHLLRRYCKNHKVMYRDFTIDLYLKEACFQLYVDEE
jgi:CRISPR/Cas system CMR subunit Cmr6 (Cas7 group RAMP superfamily)